MTRRSERVADRIRDVLASIVRAELRDPRVGFVTVTDVRLSPDLRHARVLVSFMNSAADGAEAAAEDRPRPAGDKEALKALVHATPFLRRRLAREAGLRRTPELRFEIDDSVVDGLRIEAILEEVAPAPPDDAAAEGGDDDAEPEPEPRG